MILCKKYDRKVTLKGQTKRTDSRQALIEIVKNYYYCVPHNFQVASRQNVVCRDLRGVSQIKDYKLWLCYFFKILLSSDTCGPFF